MNYHKTKEILRVLSRRFFPPFMSNVICDHFWQRTRCRWAIVQPIVCVCVFFCFSLCIHYAVCGCFCPVVIVCLTAEYRVMGATSCYHNRHCYSTWLCRNVFFTNTYWGIRRENKRDLLLDCCGTSHVILATELAYCFDVVTVVILYLHFTNKIFLGEGFTTITLY